MPLVNAYCTRLELKAALRVGTAAHDDDVLFDNCAGAASRDVDAWCGRQFWVTGTAVRVFNADDNNTCQIDDIPGTAITLKTSSAANGTYDVTWSATDYQLEPLNGVLAGLTWPYTRIRAVDRYAFPNLVGRDRQAWVQVTSTFGFGTAVPEPVREATILWAERLYKRYDSPTGIIGFGDLGGVRVSRFIDPDIALGLESYRKLDVYR